MSFKIYLGLLFILVTAILLRVYIIGNISINSFVTTPLLYTDLLGKGVMVPWRLIFLLDLCNLFLMFLIGKKLINIKFGLLASFLYSICPWMAYVQSFGSINIFLLFFFLVFLYGTLILKNSRVGLWIIIISSIVLLYSSLLNIVILPILVLGIYTAKFLSKSRLMLYIIILSVAFLPLPVASLRNMMGLKNVYRNQVEIFSDSGLKNGSNEFRGESSSAGFSNLAKWNENKYIYLSKYFLLKSIKNITPATYFTPQEKLFNFSFSPPIYAGLLIPCLYGLYLVVKAKKIIPGLPLLSLVIPSVLSKQIVDLSSLVIFSPVILILISFGLAKFYENRNKRVFKLLLVLSVSLTFLQVVVTFSDIKLRDPIRYKLSIGQVYNRSN